MQGEGEIRHIYINPREGVCPVLLSSCPMTVAAATLQEAEKSWVSQGLGLLVRPGEHRTP